MASNLHQRLSRIQRALGWSQSDLATAAKASRPAVSRWIKNGKTTMFPRHAFALSDASGYSARWLLLGEGPELVSEIEAALRAEQLRHLRAVTTILRHRNGASIA